MSLSQILVIPPGPRGFDEWSFWHYNHHQAIIAAAASVKNVSLTLYQIWPINPDNIEGFLLQHQQQHNDMNQLYGVNGADLSSLDVKDKSQVDAWLYLNFVEHAAVAKLCGVPI